MPMKHSQSQKKRWTYSESCVYNLSYHIIWCPKYRKPILVGDVAERLRELLCEKAEANGWRIRTLEIMPDHVHVFLSATPSDAVAQILATLKGGTARQMREEFPYLKRFLPTLWTRSYYVESVGHVSSKTIEKYIADQKLRSAMQKRRHSPHG